MVHALLPVALPDLILQHLHVLDMHPVLFDPRVLRLVVGNRVGVGPGRAQSADRDDS